MYKLIFSLIVLFIDFSIFSDNILFRTLPIFFFLIILIDELIKKKFIIKLPSKNFSLLFFLAIMVVASILFNKREDVSLLFGLFKITIFLLFLLSFYVTINNKTNEWELLKIFINFVYIPLLLFVSLNLILFFIISYSSLGYNMGGAVILSYFGITMQRVSFILSKGVNSYGAFLGILFTLSLIGFGVLKINRKLFLIGIIVSGISLLLTDSRGPIVFSLFVFFIIKFYYFKTDKPRFLWVIPLLGFVGPLLILSILAFIASTEYGEMLSRSSGDLATGNSRGIIWAIALSDFIVFDPQHHIFGYGEYGHYSAGLSPQWAFVFGGMEGAEYMHPHNTFLSIALDYGYVGLALFTIVQYAIVNSIKTYWNENRLIATLLLGNIVYFNLVGIGETMFGFYYQNVLYLFFMINIFAFILKNQLSVNNKNLELLNPSIK